MFESTGSLAEYPPWSFCSDGIVLSDRPDMPGVNRAGGGETNLLLRRQLDLDLPSNGPRHFTLQSEDITEVALVAVSPKMLVASCADQLRCDSDPVARTLHRTLHYGIDVQFSRDLRYGLLGILVVHDGGAGD